METENVLDRSSNISVFTGLQNVMDRYGTDQKAIQYNGNIVYIIISQGRVLCEIEASQSNFLPLNISQSINVE